MGSLAITHRADCEAIVNAFEKAAVYSTDPRSVYAMTTPIISRIRSDANNTDNQIGRQFAFQEAAESRRDSTNAGVNFQTSAALSAETDQPTTSTPAPAEDKLENYSDFFMRECIPCGDRIKSALKFNEDFFSAEGFGQQYLDILINSLNAAVKKLENILNMFKNQGSQSLQNLCEFLNLFNRMCPSDIAIIIKGLSTLLFKWSVDLFGDFSFITGILAALIGPLISGILQMLKNWMKAIGDPIKCIINNLLKQAKGLSKAFNEFDRLESAVGSGFGVQASIAEDLPSSLLPKHSSEKIRIGETSAINPFTGEEYEDFPFKPVTVRSGLDRSERDRISSVHGIKAAKDRSYSRFLELEGEREELEKILSEQHKDKDLFKGVTAEQRAQIKAEHHKNKSRVNEIKAELDDAYMRKTQKFVSDAINSAESFSSNLADTIFTVADYLIELAEWIEEYARKWLKELGKLVGDSLTIDMGFLKTQGKKLTTLQMIGILGSYLEFMRQGFDKDKCNPEDIGKILTKAYGYEDQKVVVGEKGVLRLVDSDFIGGSSVGIDRVGLQTSQGLRDENEDNAENYSEQSNRRSEAALAKWGNLDIKPTEDLDFDTAIASLGQVFTSPTEVIFSCNSGVSSKPNVEQIKEWIEELQD